MRLLHSTLFIKILSSKFAFARRERKQKSKLSRMLSSQNIDLILPFLNNNITIIKTCFTVLSSLNSQIPILEFPIHALKYRIQLHIPKLIFPHQSISLNVIQNLSPIHFSIINIDANYALQRNTKINIILLCFIPIDKISCLIPPLLNLS